MLPRTIADSKGISMRFFERLVGKGRGRDRARKGREEARIIQVDTMSGGEKGGRVNMRQTRRDQLRNSIKVGHVSKCGAIPEVSNFLVKARKLPVSYLAS